jgi:hypothetical protein
MNALQLGLAHLVKLGLLALLVGIVVRGRLRLCLALPVCLLAMLVGNTLVSLAPEHFYNASFWVLKQGVYDILKMAVALELAWRALSAFPGAWRSARVVLLAVLTLSTLTLAVLTPRSSYRTLWEWQPSVTTATVWLLTATALLVVWYQVPIHDWQRAIMLGLAPYSLVFVTLLDLLRRRGWTLRAELGVADSVAFLALVLFWTWEAWRKDEVELPEAAVGILA